MKKRQHRSDTLELEYDMSAGCSEALQLQQDMCRTFFSILTSTTAHSDDQCKECR